MPNRGDCGGLGAGEERGGLDLRPGELLLREPLKIQRGVQRDLPGGEGPPDGYYWNGGTCVGMASRHSRARWAVVGIEN
jgi:hypothetical protein